MQTTFPAWLFPVTHGATTMWERWDGWTPDEGFQDAGMNSFNHYAYGAVGAWMYRTVAGIESIRSGPPTSTSFSSRSRAGGLAGRAPAITRPMGQSAAAGCAWTAAWSGG